MDPYLGPNVRAPDGFVVGSRCGSVRSTNAGTDMGFRGL